MDVESLIRSLHEAGAMGFEGPRPPDFYSNRQELAGDPEGLDMLRRGYQPAPRETFQPEVRPDLKLGPLSVPGASIDALIAQLSEDVGRMPARNFGQGLARGFTRGLIAPQVQGMNERAQRNTEGRARVADVNREAVGTREELRRAAMRMAMERRAKREAEARRPMVPVPAWMAQALGRDDLIGQSVPETEWDTMRQMFDDRLQLRAAERAERERPRPEPKPDLSKSAFINAMAKRTNLLRREQQLTAKLEAMDSSARRTNPERANRLQDDLDKVQAELAGVEEVLDNAPESWLVKPDAEATPTPQQQDTGAASEATSAFLGTLRAKGVADAKALDAFLAQKRPDGMTIGTYAKSVGVDIEAVRRSMGGQSPRNRNVQGQKSQAAPSSSRPPGRPQPRM